MPRITITNDNSDFVRRMKAQLQATNFNGQSVCNIRHIGNFTALMFTQGPVHFDENGIRNVAELRVLQYRTTYVDGTPLNDTIDNATLDLVEVGYVRGNESDLEFLDNNHSIWQSEGMCIILDLCTYY